MTQYNTLNTKSGIKNGTEVTSSNVDGGSNDENNFLHTLFLTSRQVSKLCKVFSNIPLLMQNYQKFSCKK